MTRRTSRVVRLGIVILVLDHLQNGAWALFDARSYYRSLPGADPAGGGQLLSQVLVRDLGAARLTLALVLAVGAFGLDRRVLIVVLAASVLAGTIRLVNHAVSASPEGWYNWAGYGAAVAIPLALLIVIMARAERAGLP